MSLDQIIRKRRVTWDRLETIVSRLAKRGARRTPVKEVNELVHLYREVSADLARIRALEADPALIREINRLVVRAHGQVYRGTSRRSLGLRWFFMVGYPRLFRQTWRFSLASFLCSALFAVMSYHTVQAHPEIVADILGGADQEFQGEKTAEDIKGRFRSTPAPLLSSVVTTNNIKVALLAFALGITFGVGTVYILIVNGTMLGGFVGAYAASGAAADFWITVLPHGALELSAIVVAGGSGLLMGYSLWCPGQRTRRRALREEALRAGQLVVGLIPAFVVAGFFEGFITPSDQLPDFLKVGLGVSAAVAFWAHLLLGGRRVGQVANLLHHESLGK
ncbi:MAG: stage II sporulation protein M [Phycisphaerae bacterium]|nr:stage II sporulation protein M [Phycisphaerae bacterium]